MSFFNLRGLGLKLLVGVLFVSSAHGTTQIDRDGIIRDDSGAPILTKSLEMGKASCSEHGMRLPTIRELMELYVPMGLAVSESDLHQSEPISYVDPNDIEDTFYYSAVNYVAPAGGLGKYTFISTSGYQDCCGLQHVFDFDSARGIYDKSYEGSDAIRCVKTALAKPPFVPRQEVLDYLAGPVRDDIKKVLLSRQTNIPKMKMTKAQELAFEIIQKNSILNPNEVGDPLMIELAERVPFEQFKPTTKEPNLMLDGKKAVVLGKAQALPVSALKKRMDEKGSLAGVELSPITFDSEGLQRKFATGPFHRELLNLVYDNLLLQLGVNAQDRASYTERVWESTPDLD